MTVYLVDRKSCDDGCMEAERIFATRAEADEYVAMDGHPQQCGIREAVLGEGIPLHWQMAKMTA